MIDRTDLYWNGKKLGVIEQANLDNFDFYGRWQSTCDKDYYSSFLETVEQEGGAFVSIGGGDSQLTGSVEIEPSDIIEIKLRNKPTPQK